MADYELIEIGFSEERARKELEREEAWERRLFDFEWQAAARQRNTTGHSHDLCAACVAQEEVASALQQQNHDMKQIAGEWRARADAQLHAATSARERWRRISDKGCTMIEFVRDLPGFQYLRPELHELMDEAALSEHAGAEDKDPQEAPRTALTIFEQEPDWHVHDDCRCCALGRRMLLNLRAEILEHTESFVNAQNLFSHHSVCTGFFEKKIEDQRAAAKRLLEISSKMRWEYAESLKESARRLLHCEEVEPAQKRRFNE